jgi:ribonucleoside-diphosphate reductase alpha chain
MLEYVIKRNGSREVADASKINNWMEALSTDIKDRLDWTSVVMEVFKECPEEMTTQDLQMALSRKFVSKHTWVSSLMGGRLYAIWHWKNLFGDTIPTVKHQHQQMVALGLMEEMGYTDVQLR